jgi:hypothetical protein
VTSSGIEPVTFQFVAQCLNHYTTTYPIQSEVSKNNLINEEGGRRKQSDGALVPDCNFLREIN